MKALGGSEKRQPVAGSSREVGTLAYLEKENFFLRRKRIIFRRAEDR